MTALLRPVPGIDPSPDWWRSAVTYQVYIRSFADADGDGIGDVAGIRSKLPYLAELGVDAIWINPWYPSPQADGGYDVADYRRIEPAFGSLEEAWGLVADAHELGLRVLCDIVPNHTSDEHEWFVAALAAAPGSPERDRYMFRTGRGVDGELPPNDWHSAFGGSAWQRVIEADGRPGEWYLHIFDIKQPDLNWENPEVLEEFLDILRFWFDAGVDGFRIDVAHGLVKKDGLPDLQMTYDQQRSTVTLDHPFWDRPEVHEIYRGWRQVADAYDPPRVFVAEAWVATPERLSHYLRSDELHTAFDFDFVRAPFLAEQMRETISSSLVAHDSVGAPVMWVLSNHDITRHVTRLGRPQGEGPVLVPHGNDTRPSDLALGTRRARAQILLELALPGGVYLYQGEELGLFEVEDLPEDVLADPVWERTGRTERGRDGCRVPIPWATSGPSLGFGAGAPWLPQPAEFAALSAQAQEGDRSSVLWLYRDALRIRRGQTALGSTGRRGGSGLTWLELGADVLGFSRDPGFCCVVNVGSTPAELPAGEVLLASVPLVDGLLPADAAVWLATS